MAYTKQTWTNLPSKTTPINASRLNHMEQGIYDANQLATQSAAGQMSKTDKQKLDGVETGAKVNVQSDWNQSDGTKDDFIKNKPGNATDAKDGFMSKEDKDKMDDLAVPVVTGTQIEF